MKAQSAALLGVVISLCGCATNYITKFYRDNTAQASPEQLAKVLLPHVGKSMIYTTNDMDRDGQNLLRRGYLLLGVSGFQGGGAVTDAMLMEQAEEVGADVVLYASKHLGSVQTAVPYMQYHPGQTSTTNSSGSVNANAYNSGGGSAYGNANYYGTSTTTSPGTFSTTMVPVTVERYEHTATFWRKARPRALGVNVDNLPNELRIKLQRNTGVFVLLVIDDSPAYKANILAGDILLSMDGVSIDSVADFSPKVDQFAGKRCEIRLLRDGKELVVPVQLSERN
jgi:membrane-associated protease RseP (regulator of RpoE activity)